VLGDGGPVRGLHEIAPGDRFEQLKVARLRSVQAGDQSAHHACRPILSGKRSVHPSIARVLPFSSVAVSSARVTVVPTATTRWPALRVSFTSRAVTSGTANRSGYGGSCSSGLETPVCRTIGTTGMPRVMSRTRSRSVNGRPALAISALPAPSA